MAILYVTEYEDLGLPPYEPALKTQTLSIGAVSNVSEHFDGRTKLVCLHADDICSVRFGDDPKLKATPRDMRLMADVIHYFRVQPRIQVAVIAND